jgi:hypothetical protein
LGLDEISGLGVAAILAVYAEFGRSERVNEGITIEWLPMSAQSREIFREWDTQKINFVELTGEQSTGEAELYDRSV